VLAVFVALGVVASVLTRNTLGAFSTAFGFLIGSMIVANFQPVTRGTLTYWVTGWMGYQVADTASFSVWPASVPTGWSLRATRPASTVWLGSLSSP
jgi:hypothetical protein